MNLDGASWSRSVLMPETFLERLTGLHAHSWDDSMLIPTRSVHGLGMGRPLRVVGLSRDLTVLRTDVLRPWRFRTFTKASYVLELPIDAPPPPLGAKLTMSRV